MRLSEIAPIILNIIKSHRNINAKDIARISGIAVRRIYDITTVLQSLDLINVAHIGNYTRRYKTFSWKGNHSVGDAKIRFNTNILKVSCVNGSIVKVKNSPTSIIIEGSHNLSVEKSEELK